MKETKNNMPLDLNELFNMSIFDSLCQCNSGHMNDVAITYSADRNINNLEQQPRIKKITYLQLVNNILKTYKGLKASGVQKGDIITYSSTLTPELIYTLYASSLVGSIFKPIDIELNSDELINQFEQTPSKLFFTSQQAIKNVIPVINDINVEETIVTNKSESLPKIEKIKNRLKQCNISNNNLFISWKKFYNQKLNATFPKFRINKDAIIYYNDEKGNLEKENTNLDINVQSYSLSNSDIQFERKDKIINCVEPWKDLGLVHTALCNGMTIKIDSQWTPVNNSKYIIKNNPQIWLGASELLNDLFTNEEYKNLKLTNVKYFISKEIPDEKKEFYQNRLNEMSSNGEIISINKIKQKKKI